MNSHNILCEELVQGSLWKGEFEDVKVEKKFGEVSLSLTMKPSLCSNADDKAREIVSRRCTCIPNCVPTENVTHKDSILLTFNSSTSIERRDETSDETAHIIRLLY